VTKRGRRTLAAAAATVVVLAVAAWAWYARDGDAAEPHVPGVSPVRYEERTMAPPGVRVRVQVLNTTGVRGLGRRAMLHLRAHGFDVVELGNASPARDSTLVIDVSGNAEWAERLAAAMGDATVESRPDSSRYLDAVVLIGRSWRAPAQPLDP
jgi:hypothetical protein